MSAASPQDRSDDAVGASAGNPGATGFDAWYAAYPRKRCRQDARNAYRAALRKGYTPAQLERATKALAAEGREKTYVPYPATFLRRHLEDYLVDADAFVASAPVSAADFKRTPICPTHGAGSACLWQVGAGWICER